MNIILALASDRSICESLRAAIPHSDLLLFESHTDEALRRLASIQADLVILDDARDLGINALHQLRHAHPHLPVIVLSSSGNPETQSVYNVAGARQCVIKPFQCEDLEDAIQSCVEPIQDQRTTLPLEVREPVESPVMFNRHQMALRWMSRNIAHLDDPASLTSSLVDAAIDIFDATRAAVLLQSDGFVRIVAHHNVPSSLADSLRLSFAEGLMRRLDESATLIERDAARESSDTTKEMMALGAQIAVPLVTAGRTCGALVLGSKASGERYALEERELLAVMARCASACLERAQRYRDVARQQNRIDAVLANITAGVITVAPDKTITMMNESAGRILQLQPEDILGRSVQRAGSAFADVTLRTLAEGKPRLRQRIHDVAIDKDLGLSVTPLGAEGVVAIFSALPDEGTDEHDEDVRYSPIWKFLSTRVAQEIKNPMVAINTFAQLLPNKHDSAEFREEFSEVVQKEVARINSVVEALYEFARHPRLDRTRKNFDETIREVVSRFETTLAERNITLETHFGAKSAADIEIDPGLFSQAVENVIRNSIDAMPNGGTLTVETRRDNGSCELIITDSGDGISEQDAELIFTPFYSTKENGMGLGLTVASRIIHEHEGSLELLSGAEGGGSFLLNLPAATEGE